MRAAGQRVVVVTGAASGIGRATADLFRSMGDTVLGFDLAAGAGIAACDVTDRDAVERVIGAIDEVDVLANVAGVMRFGPLDGLDLADWDQHLAVNLTGPLLTSRAALAALRRTRGCIVNVASVAGVMGQAYCAAYCASKGGLVMLTKALAVELALDRIRVNCVCPGGVDTPLIAGVNIPTDANQALMNRISAPLPGLAKPAEIAEAIAYLAGARSVTGSALVIDRGQRS